MWGMASGPRSRPEAARRASAAERNSGGAVVNEFSKDDRCVVAARDERGSRSDSAGSVPAAVAAAAAALRKYESLVLASGSASDPVAAVGGWTRARMLGARYASGCCRAVGVRERGRGGSSASDAAGARASRVYAGVPDDIWAVGASLRNRTAGSDTFRAGPTMSSPVASAPSTMPSEVGGGCWPGDDGRAMGAEKVKDGISGEDGDRSSCATGRRRVDRMLLVAVRTACASLALAARVRSASSRKPRERRDSPRVM